MTSPKPPKKTPKHPKTILRLRNQLYDQLEQGIDNHEKKMSYIGFVMLFTLLAVIMGFAWYDELKQLFMG